MAQETLTPFSRLKLIHSHTPQLVKKAKGVLLSIISPDDTAFVDILTATDGTLLAQYMWRDNGEYDVMELTELSDDECERIIQAIKE